MCSLILICTNLLAQKQELSTRAIISKMLATIAANKGYSYNMHGFERIAGMEKVKTMSIYAKCQTRPEKIYIKLTSGHRNGTEILYVAGERNNEALVNIGKLVPNLTINPYSDLLTENQRHTIFAIGFNTTGTIITELLKRVEKEKKFNTCFSEATSITWNGRACYKLSMNYPGWGYSTYKAQANETISSIAQKLSVAEYGIMEANNIKLFAEELNGRTLKVPNFYAKKCIFYIDKQSFLPIYQEMHDENGIFEHYEFTDIQINPAFKADEFSSSFKEYKF